MINLYKNLPARLQDCLYALDIDGIDPYFVGGAVRDAYMGLESDDIDICLVGCTNLKVVRPTILHYADSITEEVGASFSVLIADFSGMKIDFALARTEQNIGPHHRDVSVNVVGVSIEDDLARRDLTINAIAIHCLTGEVVDPFNGIGGIIYSVAQPPTKAFAEDALRVYRAARFIARFDLTPTDELLDMCWGMTREVGFVAKERVGMEFDKMLKQSKTPSKFFKFLRDTELLHIHFPEIHALVDVQQDPEWHPEGCVFSHTMHCMDQATTPFMRCVMLCHDLGKPATFGYNAKGRISARGHDAAGVQPTLSLLGRIKWGNLATQAKVAKLVELHMFHTNQKFTRKNVAPVIRKLAKVGLSFTDLQEVCRCDVSGRPPLKKYTPYIGEDIAKQLIEEDLINPVVTGDMLISEGWEQGRLLGEGLKWLLKMQDKGNLTKENWKFWAKNAKKVVQERI